MQKRLYFLRHGETDWNLDGKMQGQQDIPLNSTGREQAYITGQILQHQPIERIVSATLCRAYETANIVNSFLNVPLTQTTDLNELSAGICEGKSLRFISMQYAPLIKDMLDKTNPNRFSLSLPMGESWRDAERRVLDCINDTALTYPEHHILFVSHYGIIQNLLITQLGIDFEQNNCACVSCLYDTQTHQFSQYELVYAGCKNFEDNGANDKPVLF